MSDADAFQIEHLAAENAKLREGVEMWRRSSEAMLADRNRVERELQGVLAEATKIGEGALLQVRDLTERLEKQRAAFAESSTDRERRLELQVREVETARRATFAKLVLCILDRGGKAKIDAPIVELTRPEAFELLEYRDAESGCYVMEARAITETPKQDKPLCGVWVPEMGPCVAYVPCEVHTEKRKDVCGAAQPGAYGTGYGYPLTCSKDMGHAPPHRNDPMGSEWE